MGCKQFKEKSNYYQIDRRSLYLQNGKDFSNNLDRKFLNSEFEFKPVIRFFVIQELLTLIVQDQTKNNSNQFTLKVSLINTNHELIDIIRKEIGVEASSFIQVMNETKKLLIYKNNSTLANSKISDNNRLIVSDVDEEPNEDSSSFKFSSIVQNSDKFYSFSHRSIQKGLNIEGICKNKNCKYLDILQISPQGLGNTEIIGWLQKNIFCINQKCKGNLEINTCIFYDCNYKWKGIKSVEGEIEQVVEQKYQNIGTAPEDYSIINLKNTGKSSNQAFWINLWIETVTKEIICQICCEQINSGEDKTFEKCDNQFAHQAHLKCLNALKHNFNQSSLDQCFNCFK